jgi:hypothetical protein
MHWIVRAMRTVLLIGLIAMAGPGPAVAQLPAVTAHKGNIFLYWGYNRSGYSWSDIHFDGPGYDLTLRHVEATDRPIPFDPKLYFDPRTLTLPQYNYRLGWFFQDRWSISLGMDHMKYVVVQGQQVRMDGFVDASRSVPHAAAEGSHEVTLDPDLLTYEHSDGLNLLSLDVDHYDPLWQSRNGRHALHVFEGVHAGPVIPRTDVRLFGEGINNRFHLAGYGVGAQVGLHLGFFRHGFLRVIGKAGWIDLPSVLTTGTAEDRASQHFWFWQYAVVLGGQFRLHRSVDR